jgi:hypothetical protein
MIPIFEHFSLITRGSFNHHGRLIVDLLTFLFYLFFVFPFYVHLFCVSSTHNSFLNPVGCTAMVAIGNGMSAYGALVPYTATFLVFITYCFPAVRMAAIAGHRQIAIMTHDSIGLGTHLVLSSSFVPNVFCVFSETIAGIHGDCAEHMASNALIATKISREDSLFSFTLPCFLLSHFKLDLNSKYAFCRRGWSNPPTDRVAGHVPRYPQCFGDASG